MKITLITDQTGALVGTIHGYAASGKKGDVEAGLVLGPELRTRQVEVDDALSKVSDANELHRKLAQYMRT